MTLRATALTAAVIVAGVSHAGAQDVSPMPPAPCVAPASPGPVAIPFFGLDFQPSDGLLDVWCRMQGLKPGKYTVGISFTQTKARRQFEIEFDGARSLSRDRFRRFVQNLFPAGDETAATDASGQPFPSVLRNVVQAVALKTPDGQELGLPAAYPGSRALALWEPVVLRIEPIMVGTKPFALSVRLVPSVAAFLMALQGESDPFVIKASRKQVTPFSNLSNLSLEGQGGQCLERIPACRKLPDVVDIHMPWLLEGVYLESGAGGLSTETRNLFTQLATSFGGKKGIDLVSTMGSFDPLVGEASVTARDSTREMEAKATPDLNKTQGTRTVVVKWSERPGVPTTYVSSLREWSRKRRSDLLGYYGTAAAPAD